MKLFLSVPSFLLACKPNWKNCTINCAFIMICQKTWILLNKYEVMWNKSVCCYFRKYIKVIVFMQVLLYSLLFCFNIYHWNIISLDSFRVTCRGKQENRRHWTSKQLSWSNKKGICHKRNFTCQIAFDILSYNKSKMISFSWFT